MPYQSEFMTLCQERGFLHQCTDERALDVLLTKDDPVTAYIGFDCTAPSLHVGSLIQIMLLYWWQQCGHRPVVLMGGGTTKIGDPSGKDEARQLLDEAGISHNMQGIKQVFSQFLQFGESHTDAVMVNNADWLDGLQYIEFLRDYGRHFSVNRMLSMESVKRRLDREEGHLSFLEFNYMILQAYDFVELHKRLGCRVQFGGSDQWGNIVNGMELQRRLQQEDSQTVYGLTTPLLTSASGAKMGKTAQGAIWLNPEMLSAYDYWQFWRNTEDADVGRFLKLFTTLPLDEIARLASLQGAEINEAKKKLATEATALLHGMEAAQAAAQTATQTFEQGKTSQSLPEAWVAASEANEPMAAFKLFQLAGLASSGKEARRLIQGGGARINDVQVTDENSPVNARLLLEEGDLKLSSGKKKHVLLRINASA